MAQSKARSYTFTLNNYSDEDEGRIQNLECKYLIYGRETASTGTPHLQGYIQFKNPKSFKSTIETLGKSHVEIAKGTPQQNITYCSKTDPNPYEKGDKPTQGKRSDIDNVREVVKQTNSMRAVVEVAQSYQAVRMAELHLKYSERVRECKPTIYWFYGATGTGKTRKALEILGKDAYIKSNNDKWFEGYDAHPNILFDDFRSSTFPFHFLLQLLDRYPCRVECKGSSRQFLATTIIITSPFSPMEMYKTLEDKQQLIRRLDYITNFSNQELQEQLEESESDYH